MALYHTVNGSPVEVNHINRNSSAVNYVIKDEKLVFADHGLYLTGPVNYELVGSPTIVDGAVSGFSGSDYLLSDTTQTVSVTSAEWNFKFNTGTLYTSGASYAFGFQVYGGISIRSTKELRLMWHNSNNSWVEKATGYFVQDNTTYTVNVAFNNTAQTAVITVKDGSGTVVFTDIYTENTYGAKDGSYFIGMRGTTSATYNDNYWRGSIDLKETYIKLDGSLWFYGKNYATQNIAPVPAGYTYGNTTTPSIGYVDMRTQAFTAAPSGATIGKDA